MGQVCGYVGLLHALALVSRLPVHLPRSRAWREAPVLTPRERVLPGAVALGDIFSFGDTPTKGAGEIKMGDTITPTQAQVLPHAPACTPRSRYRSHRLSGRQVGFLCWEETLEITSVSNRHHSDAPRP